MARTRGPDYERKRLEIAERAAEVVARRGYHSTRMEDIAAALGIGRTTIYWYFPDKEAIARTLIERNVLRFQEELHQELAAATGAPEKLLAYARATLRFNREKREHIRIAASIWAEAEASDFEREVHSGARELQKQAFALVTELVAEGVRAGELRTVVPREYALLFQAALDGFLYEAMIDPDAVSEEESLELLERGLVHPIRPGKVPAQRS